MLLSRWCCTAKATCKIATTYTFRKDAFDGEEKGEEDYVVAGESQLLGSATPEELERLQDASQIRRFRALPNGLPRY